MQGLELAERFFAQVGAPMITARFPALDRRLAVGLVGHGSECYGFDDETSRDHDWGPSFCVWLTRRDHRTHGQALREAIDALPRSFAGFDRTHSAWGSNRVGVFEIGDFYRSLIGLARPPRTLGQWRSIHEESLAMATNGRVFVDRLGSFTRFRQALLAFYPEDVRRKKIAARCMAMAQSGQYNFMRSIHRGERVAARMAESCFIGESVSMVFLLNRVYKPYYKWMHRALRNLPIAGPTSYQLLRDLVSARGHEAKHALMEAACQVVIAELRRQGLTDSSSDSLMDHGPEVQAGIEDPTLRAVNVWLE
ncbi:DUF4037 domain-containing protein [Paraliomyxa miuraensis]|uniref:DUF4037 domain-containing protein n=1 Tax=Paraliomyxa miuraensis TaxID=376150 RepID=UPI00224F9BC1|nr:DUF4037 domain-containing protein [Paraliomyxa miuraensis]